MLRSSTLRAFMVAILAGVVAASATISIASAEAITTTRKGASYADVRQDLESAIIEAGLKIDYSGNINAMLTRTGPDVGSNQPIYQNAEFFTFCSAKLSRQMMEADPANMQHCPYVVFIYQRVATVREVVVGYRKIEETGRGKQVLGEINALLARIVKTAAASK